MERSNFGYCCGNCAFHEPFSGACCCGDSDFRADFTDDEFLCDKWSGKLTEKEAEKQ